MSFAPDRKSINSRREKITRVASKTLKRSFIKLLNPKPVSFKTHSTVKAAPKRYSRI